MRFQKISNMENWSRVVETENKFFLLKNSITCPISQEAFNETEKFAKENVHIPVYYLHVQEARPLSNNIAEQFQVKHESPQALLFEDGKVRWHDSHWEVTKENLTAAWEK